MKARLALFAACCVALTGCTTMSKMWPFHHKVKAGPPAVHELNLVNADGSAATYPQYWVRNTLVIDLSGVGGNGSVAARLPEETTWPVRVAVRVRPGSVEQLEVQGEERDILPVTKDGAKPIDIELAHSVYTPKTAAIYIAWSPMPVFAEPLLADDSRGVVTAAPTAAPTHAMAANVVPRLNIVWNCDDCTYNDKVIPLILEAYKDEAADHGKTVSDAETANVSIIEFRQRNPGLRYMLGILSGKDRVGVKMKFRREVLEIRASAGTTLFGMNSVCESIAKKLLKEIETY